MLKNKTKRTLFNKIDIDIFCEWMNCHFSCVDLDDFETHLLSHLKNACDNTKDNVICCGVCFVNLSTDFSAIRHMYYHGYHLNLKARGKYLLQSLNHGPCTLDSTSSNIIPCIDQPFLCQWEECDYSDDNVSAFYNHIDCHVNVEMSKDINIKPYCCKWKDCNFVTNIGLRTHLPYHCEKSYIACPTCGLGFSNTTKLLDHIKRQVVHIWKKSMEAQEISEVLHSLNNSRNPVIPVPKSVVAPPNESFQCDICYHLFVTKRMLTDHKKRHVSTLTCLHCSHTCSSKYALKRHILFRHTEEKPFSCTECEKSFKCNDILRRHMESVHRTDIHYGPVQCDVSWCTYTSKDIRSLNIHKSKIHCKLQNIVTKVFVCHVCEQQYVKGILLTDHLSKKHGINKVSDRYRHQYKVCKDGKYRLNMYDFITKTDL